MARPSSLSGLSIADLQAEIERRQNKLVKARKKAVRNLLKAEAALAQIDAGLAAQGAAPAGGKRAGKRGGKRKAGRPKGRASAKGAAKAKATGGKKGRGKRGGRTEGPTLVSTIYQVLKGKTMNIQDIMAAVRAAGYKSNSPNFRVMVNQTLVSAKFKKMFKRAGRGVYTGI